MVSCGGLSLIDLGIAREYKGDATTDTHHFGTRAYAPPEQFGFGQTTVRSDVYALGMILYFCLVEQTPDAVVRERGFFDPRIPDPVRLVLMRATEFDPALRYKNVRELKRAFCSAVRACGFAGSLSAPFEREDVPPADLSGCVSASSFTCDSMPHSGKLQQMEVAVKSAFRSAALNVGFALQKTPLVARHGLERGCPSGPFFCCWWAAPRLRFIQTGTMRTIRSGFWRFNTWATALLIS